ncbi:MAG: hypothetical protein A3F80_00620 [Candidatus Melainabacteria bacterium RIFCSPLOWO2_12_FULL_35_11]|nr:MAG: hypothetical protein A3F80_00620 [Candidatus Melainabacteria bacterium RIFCSPLOWO2_12_FULL_35_11]
MINSRSKISCGILIFIVLFVCNQARSQDFINQEPSLQESFPATPPPALPQESIPSLPLPSQETAQAEQIQPSPPMPQIQPSPPMPQIQPSPPMPQIQPSPPMPQIQPSPPMPQIQPSPPMPQIQPSPPMPPQPLLEEKRERFHFFWHNEQREKYRKELKDLKNRQKQEIEDLWKKRKQETEDLKKKIENDRAQEKALKKKVMEKQTESMLAAQKTINERNKEVLEVKKSDNTVEIITNKEDPLYIQKAQVLKSKTEFMKIGDVDFKYKLELHNQTPKIINFVLIVWERKLAFNETQTLAKEIKVSKPIAPYENRIVEYNELNSKREGETYKVEIAKVVFEDGTQWKNPAVKDKEL